MKHSRFLFSLALLCAGSDAFGAQQGVYTDAAGVIQTPATFLAANNLLSLAIDQPLTGASPYALALDLPGNRSTGTLAANSTVNLTLGSAHWSKRIDWVISTPITLTIGTAVHRNGDAATTTTILLPALAHYRAIIRYDGANVFWDDVLAADVWVISIGDETTVITAGAAKVTFRAPYAAVIRGVRASLTTASSSGDPTIDINEAGTSVLGTKLSIDANELASTTAASAATITDPFVADFAEITVDVDTAGTGAKGGKIYVYVER